MPTTTALGASTWHENTDPYTRRAAPTLRYTRNAPPPRWYERTRGNVDTVAGFTPDQDLMVTSIRQAAHAVLHMAAGGSIDHITVHPAGSDRARQSRGHTRLLESHGTWLALAVTHACGERAADRYLREARLWSPDRAWAIERLAADARTKAADTVEDVFGRPMTYGVELHSEGDYAGLTAQADQVLGFHWHRVITLARHVFQERHLTGADAAHIAAF